MWFECKRCKRLFFRDLRETHNKALLTKRGFKSFCNTVGTVTYSKQTKVPPGR